MFSDVMMYLMILDMIVVLYFVGFQLLSGKRKLIHWLYACQSFGIVIWQIAIIAMQLADPDDTTVLFLCDAVSNVGAVVIPVLILLLAIAYTKELQRLPRICWLILVPTVISVLIIFTNPWHHLHYRVFSVYPSEIVFGPFLFIKGAFCYICLLCAMVITTRYAVSSNNKLYVQQSALFIISFLVPLMVSILATLQVFNLSIAITPLSFVVTIACQGIAIYYFDFLNIEPLALERVLDSISDAYIVLAEELKVVSFNKPFAEAYTKLFDIHIGSSLEERAHAAEDDMNSSILFNLLSSIRSAHETGEVISYEQALLNSKGMNYYSVEVTPLILGKKIYGYIAMFRDVTRLRDAARREQENITRSMARERLASLGQMIGGISHNLKTPIMSISGSVGVMEKLAKEYNVSIDDPQVTLEDHKEIYEEMRLWLSKIQDCCAYMSDIITTVKGLATNMNTSENGEIDIDELHKRVHLLMQHELKKGNCTLTYQNLLTPGVRINGDINNLVQIVNNLIGNAIDAMQEKGGGVIVLTSRQDQNQIILSVADNGPGIPPAIREKLFKEMITSKGTKGTGLGLYTSNVLMQGKFGGSLWLEDTQEGTMFSLSVPIGRPEDKEKAEAATGGMHGEKE